MRCVKHINPKYISQPDKFFCVGMYGKRVSSLRTSHRRTQSRKQNLAAAALPTRPRLLLSLSTEYANWNDRGQLHVSHSVLVPK